VECVVEQGTVELNDGTPTSGLPCEPHALATRPTSRASAAGGS